MRKKQLIELTVGDLTKLAIAWYFFKPLLKRIDVELTDKILDSHVVERVVNKTDELHERNMQRRAERKENGE